MTPVYRSTGCSTPWVVAPDHGRTRNDGARLAKSKTAGFAWGQLAILTYCVGLTALTIGYSLAVSL